MKTIGAVLVAASVFGISAFAVSAPVRAQSDEAIGESAGCSDVNRGLLNINFSSPTPISRQLMLEEGDRIAFSASGASVALTGGFTAPLALVSTGGSGGTFKAPRNGAYTFQITATTEAGSSVAASCSSGRAAANAAFLNRRKSLLNSRDPDRLRIDRPATPIANAEKPLSSTVTLDNDGRAKDVGFSVSLSEITAATNGGKGKPGIVDFWLEGRMQNYETGRAAARDAGNLGVLYVGTRSMVGPDIMVGAMAQLDRGVESALDGTDQMRAEGWMFGPYVSMKVAPGVVFDGRAAWGETVSAVSSPDIDNGFTQRSLLRGKLTGTRDYSGWKVAPSVGMVYIEDAVRDGSNGAMKAAGSGKVEVLPEVTRRFELDEKTFIEPRAAVGAFVGFNDLNAINPMVTTVNPTDLQLKAEAGVVFGVKDGSTLQATGGVESGATSGTETWRGRLQLNMPLGD